MSRKDTAIARIATAALNAAAADQYIGRGSSHSDVLRREVGDAIADAQAAGATDDEIRAGARKALEPR